MQAIKIIMLLAIAFLLSACRSKEQQIILNEGDPAPLFSLKDFDGNVWDIEKTRGKVVLLNFWAPWCQPCKREMPSLQQLLLKMGNKPDFVILTVLDKEDRTKALKFMRDYKLNLTVLLDEHLKVTKMFGVTGLPETYIIDKKGVLRRKIIGPTLFNTPDASSYLSGLFDE